MSSVVISGDTSGAVTISAPAVAGTTTLTLPAISGTILQSGTAVTEAQGGTGTTTGYYGFKNRIINGAMVIDQRNAGASVTPANDAYMTDRWKYGSSQASKFTAQQVSTAPTGFINSLKMTVASAVAVGAGDYFTVYQPIEGLNVADLAWGTASASTVTLSFYVYSSLTGTFGGTLRNSAGSRSYPFTYTISTSNTWEQKSVTVAGDTTGTWLTTNGVGIYLHFGLGAGATFSGTAGAWAAANYISATGATSVVGTNGATFYITGVQLEKGSTATSFDYRPYGTELALCQRYFWNITGDANGGWGHGQALGTTNARLFLKFPVTMRASPTLSYTGSPYVTASTGSGRSISSFGTNYGGITSTQFDSNISSGGLTAGNAVVAALGAGTDMVSATSEL